MVQIKVRVAEAQTVPHTKKEEYVLCGGVSPEGAEARRRGRAKAENRH